jgi:hypothetical protein
MGVQSILPQTYVNHPWRDHGPYCDVSTRDVLFLRPDAWQ